MFLGGGVTANAGRLTAKQGLTVTGSTYFTGSISMASNTDGNINMNNSDITNANRITINDAGEGLQFNTDILI